MKTPKDRLHRVLVIGATPVGIAAANKLGEMGISVVLVDRDMDLDVKLAREEWRLASGQPLNYAHRPGLLRILRNSRIRCVLPGEVTSLKHTPQGFSARIKAYKTFIDPDRCTLCGRCVEVCPVKTREGCKPVSSLSRQSLPGRPVIDKRRQPLCQAGCPLGVNAQAYMALTAEGRYAEALAVVRRDNVLPGICGRICTHPCESSCRRGELDAPLAIRDIKRFLADYELKHPGGAEPFQVAWRAERVAVVGSGPAGLAAAADLARQGYPVTIFEKEELPGGLLRFGIGPHRLPREILEREIQAIEELGVEIKTSHPIAIPQGLEALSKDFAAVIATVGIWSDRRLGAPGEELKGVEGCLEMLGRIYRGEVKELKEKVAVIGDGNAAFDLARALVRVGAQVTIVSWFPRDLIPADAEELRAAEEEGILIVDRTQVTGFTGRDGRLEALQCAVTKPGEPDAKGIPWPVMVPGEKPFQLSFQRVVVAIGQKAGMESGSPQSPVIFTPGGLMDVDGNSRVGLPRVFAAGDAVTGPSSVVQAMADGRRAAASVYRELTGEKPPFFRPNRPTDKDFPPLTADIPSIARANMPERQAVSRRNSFAEVALGLTEAQVRSEASRCLQCGMCSECLQCLDVCRSGAILHEDETPSEGVEQVGVVIVADSQMAPAIKGEDVLRAYNVRGSKDDVQSMMLRGFAAAAEAMILLGGGSQGLRGHGLSFSPPDPRLSEEVRMGVFVCRCNDAYGWPEALTRYVASLTSRTGIVVAEVLDSACTPEGTTTLLHAIREKNLSRVVLASCVCCPLDFICSACTDQRSRLKDALFKGTGISRAMFETSNLRGEVLRLLPEDPELAVDRFMGLMERSIGRVGYLKSLPAPARPYNFTTAVIGNSEPALRSAMLLAESGMEVLLFDTEVKEGHSRSISHPSVHNFAGCRVKGIRGTVGNFQVIVEMNESVQHLQAGAVILGEQSRKRIPYMPSADLPPHLLEFAGQTRGVNGIPYFGPGASSVPGLFLVNPPGVNATDRVKGAAAAILAASVMPRRPRQNKGYTVVVDEDRCRGCGRCFQVCPYHAVNFQKNRAGGWSAVVDEAICKGCGNCIPVCPSNAADSPYRDRRYLERMIEEILFE